jgi:hypothetical protein
MKMGSKMDGVDNKPERSSSGIQEAFNLMASVQGSSTYLF